MLRYLIAAVLVALVAYGLVEAWPLIEGPALTVETPADQASFPGGIVTISGRASRIASLTLDGAELLHDQAGNFSAVLTFPRGESILTFVATDRFGRRTQVTRSLFVP